MKGRLQVLFWVFLLLLFLPSPLGAKVLKVTDALGRRVKVTVPVRRAVFLVGYEFIPYLDLWDQTVGISLWAKYENDLLRLDPAHLAKLQLVGTAVNPNLEVISSLRPDLIVTWAFQPKAVEVLASLGYPTIALSPQGLSDLFSTLRLLAHLFGREDRGHRIERAMDRLLEDLKARVASRPRPRVVFLWNQPTRVSGRRGVVPDLIRAAGGENCGDRLDLPYATVSLERIVLWDPEVIFIWGNARYGADSILSDRRLRMVTAVRQRRVYKLPPWSTWSPRAVLLALWMARRLHPEAVSPSFYQREEKLFQESIWPRR